MSPSTSVHSDEKRIIGAKEYLAFKLGSEEYGMDILKVQEIRSYEAPTKIANAPDFIKGVIDLRGNIVPIIDMRLKLKLDLVEYNVLTVVIVINVGAKVWGIVVDSVSDVIKLTPEDIKPLQGLSFAGEDEYLLGMGAIEGRMVLIVDANGLLSGIHVGNTAATLEI